MLTLGARALVKTVLHMKTKRNCQISGAQLSLGNTQRVLARIETSSVRAGGLIEITWLALLD